jgi:hypothetical protein
MGGLSDRELLMVGLALYWAEGAEDKPWRRAGEVKLINSDPTVSAAVPALAEHEGAPIDRPPRPHRRLVASRCGYSGAERWVGRPSLAADRSRIV